MTQWDVFLVVAALIGFAASVVAPILKLNTSITKLTVTVENLSSYFSKFEAENKDSHKRLWSKSEKQDERLEDHEGRIIKLEGK